MSNTINHVSDSAINIKFNPTGTDWPADVKDVQTALGKIGNWSMKDTGLSDASETEKGIIQLATQAEAIAGTDTKKAITPATLNAVVKKPEASETVFGLTRYATEAEAVAMSSGERTITAKALGHVFSNKPATEDQFGVLKVASQAQATTGTADNVIMTPLKVKQAIAALAPVTADATESNKGVVKLATEAEIQAGTARSVVAISPYQFARANATETSYGTIKVAADIDMTNRTDKTKAVTPYQFGRATATTQKTGIVRFATDDEASTGSSSIVAMSPKLVKDNFLRKVTSGGDLVVPDNTDLRASTISTGFLPNAAGHSYVGTNALKFGQIHAVDFYENGEKLEEKYRPSNRSTKRFTKLATVNSGHTTFSISEPYDNYDALYFLGGDDRMNWVTSTEHPIMALDYARNNGKSIVVCQGEWYFWVCGIAQDKKTFTMAGERNAWLYEVYGVKY